MTEAHYHYSKILDWYRACGVDAVLSDVPRNHTIATAPVKLSFRPRPAQAAVPETQNSAPSQAAINSVIPSAPGPAIVVTAPISTVPISTVPITPVPITPVPITPVPITPVVASSMPTFSAPAFSAPVFSAPIITSGDHPALTCETLDQLRYAMEHATGCDLIKAATHTVFSGGNPDADVMLIGEAPGADEDRLGEPFVGQSGQLLDVILATIGLDRTSIYIGNIIPWRPPGNRPPTAAEIVYCLPFIKRHIELVSPKILILLGGVAVKTLLNRNDGILKLRGEILEYTTNGGSTIAAMPTLHPSYIMRSASQKALVWKDMLTLKAWLANHTTVSKSFN